MAEKEEKTDIKVQSEICFQDFEKKIFEEMEKIEKQKHCELNKLDEETCKFMKIFNRKQGILRDKLEDFYEEKRLTIRRVLKETKMFKDVQSKTCSKMFQNDVTNMMDMVKYSLENFISKRAIYEKSNSLENFEIGSIVVPCFEKPFKDYSILLDERPKKILANEDGFFSFDYNGQIININNFNKLSLWKGAITNVSITYNGRMAFMETPRKNRIKIYIGEGSNTKYESVKIAIKDEKPIYDHFFILQDFIAIKTNQEIIFYSKLTSKISSKLSIYENRILDFTDVKIDKNTFFAADNNKNVIWFNIIEDQLEIIQIQEEYDNFSIGSNIIDKLKSDHYFLLINQYYIFVINSKEKNGKCFQMDKFFRDQRLLNYMKTENEIIFCLINPKDQEKVTLKHFPLEYYLT
ncbi:unnamed protein product [Dimorphilus gyrociliatus]|uniref:Uncharacterized protein n=1 Tax=Dimorphilus gyrociliatus TaxID=2664684 RepID=A0A7I8VGN6_9ANNE|nr:unnamed protein product [Dimorphilus gyrociliatus]